MDVLVLETDRLVLRELAEDDFEAVHAYGADPEVVEYVPWGPNTEQDTHDFLARTIESAAADPRLEWVLGVVPKESGRLIGAVGLHIKPLDQGKAMLGYAYAREAWGRGYATEAARAMLRLGFDVLDLRRIYATCDPDNAASAGVLRKVGMIHEGVLRHDMNIRGRVRDSLLWAILVDEWRSPMARGRSSSEQDSAERRPDRERSSR